MLRAMVAAANPGCEWGKANACKSVRLHGRSGCKRRAVRGHAEGKPRRRRRRQLLRIRAGAHLAHHLRVTAKTSCNRPVKGRSMRESEPSARKLAGIGLVLLLIVIWATFVASLAQVVGQWPIIVQAAFYLFMGIVWIIPLKPLVRWIQTGSFRDNPDR